MKGDLHLRIAVAAVGVPLCAMVVLAGGLIFSFGLALLVAIAYWEFAKNYYVKNGSPTGELNNMKDAMRFLVALYGDSTVERFGPRDLKAVRQAMIDDDLSRKVVNARVNRIKRIFKWSVENQLVQPNILHALQAVPPLKRAVLAITPPSFYSRKTIPVATGDRRKKTLSS